jgi:hypothetical protein
MSSLGMKVKSLHVGSRSIPRTVRDSIFGRRTISVTRHTTGQSPGKHCLLTTVFAFTNCDIRVFPTGARTALDF